MEVELKLLLPPGSPQWELGRLTFLGPLSRVQTQALGNAYFDTPQLALRQRDMGLRIRRRGEDQEQTLKTAGQVAGGLHARPEYNTPVSGATPELARFPDTLWTVEDRDAIQGALAVQFHTDFERQQGELTLADGTRVELALDRGVIRAGQSSESIAELELELVDGEASALLPLARALMTELPLRLGLDSKAARGYRLAGLAPQPAVVSEVADTPALLLAAWQRNEERLLAGEGSAAAPLARQLVALAAQLPVESADWLRYLAAELSAASEPEAVLLEAIRDRRYGLCQLSGLAGVLA
ncbi:inorganic triphosphatase [Ferrimonas balearica]|uniref:CYTH domain-containing protein n=1 Tax=Ferrimonas balearica TaxID=44012 RepID=UPI001C993444|nr:CYTH domain-containing protein [Ferrimonas balearica]MBY5992326.1 CYTH domain-containing protein [Ferrimonas balearica]